MNRSEDNYEKTFSMFAIGTTIVMLIITAIGIWGFVKIVKWLTTLG